MTLLGLSKLLVFFAIHFSLQTALAGPSAILMVKKHPSVPTIEYGKILIGGLIPQLKAQMKTLFRDSTINLYQEVSSSTLNHEITRIGNEPRTFQGLKKLRESKNLPAPEFYPDKQIPVVDLVLEVELREELNEPQRLFLVQLSQMFKRIGAVDLFLTQNFAFIKRDNFSSEDEFMLFAVPWKPGFSARDSQKHWREIHGPLATKLIEKQKNPQVIKSYTQLHAQEIQPLGFNLAWQGICIERVSSVLDLARESLSDPNVTVTSQTLALDEYEFSEGPAMMFLKRVSF